MKKVLVPIDLREDENALLDYAIEFAAAYNSQLTLLHVQRPTPVAIEGTLVMGGISGTTAEQELHDEIEKRHQDILRRSPNLKINTEVVLGLAGDEIVEASSDYHMIIMGSRRSNNPIVQWLGSVSNHVVLNSKCPVLVISSDMRWRPIGTALFGFVEHDGSSEHVAEFFDLNATIGADVHIAHVRLHSGDDTILKLEQYILHEYPEETITYHDCPSNRVDESLLQKATDINADIVVIGKTNKTFWDYFLRGNNSEKLLKLTDRPVLVMNRPEN